ncbi:hypothetical protein [Enterobacter cloacae complex sp. 357I10]|uniref:hypothetical protein n=1 Tax=Enterobacter cloacae complex sp. 357I10 TaxID=3395878 RepID=UPI003CF2027D
MVITYSLSETVNMFLREIIASGLAVFCAWCVLCLFSDQERGKEVPVSMKKITSKSAFSYFISSQIAAFTISLVGSILSTKWDNIVWNDEIRQFYLHVGFGLVTCVFCLLVILHEKFIKRNLNVYSDYCGSLAVSLTGIFVLCALYLTFSLPFHYEERLLNDASLVASDGVENSVVFADGRYWVFELGLPYFKQSLLKEVRRGRYQLICTTEKKPTCWSGKKLPEKPASLKASS